MSENKSSPPASGDEKEEFVDLLTQATNPQMSAATHTPNKHYQDLSSDDEDLTKLPYFQKISPDKETPPKPDPPDEQHTAKKRLKSEPASDIEDFQAKVVWHTTDGSLQGPPTKAIIKDLKRRELALIRAEIEMRKSFEKQRQAKKAAIYARDRARRNATGRLKSQFSLSLESPSDNRQANRQLGDELRMFANRCLDKSLTQTETDGTEYRDKDLIKKVVPALCDEIELPCFRVSSLNAQTLKGCFSICREHKGLPALVENFATNLGRPYALFPIFEYDEGYYYYCTNWIKEEDSQDEDSSDSE